MNIKRYLVTLYKMKLSPYLIKHKVVVYRPAVVDISKAAKIKVNGIFSFNNEWNDRLKIKNKFPASIVIEKNADVEIGDFTGYAGSRLLVGEGATFKVKDAYMNYNSVIECKNHIEIGEHCLIGERVKISDSNNHSLNYEGFKKSAPVIIGNHVWICNDSIILSGVKIGSGSVVAAGSVVTKDVPNNTVVAGVPAKVIRENTTWIQ